MNENLIEFIVGFKPFEYAIWNVTSNLNLDSMLFFKRIIWDL